MMANISDSDRCFSILPIGPFDDSFLYISEEKLNVGDVVEVPFGRRSVIGVVTNDKVQTNKELKAVSKIFGFNIGVKYLEFLRWMSSYTLISRGNILKMILAEKTIFTAKKEPKDSFTKVDIHNFQNITLSEEQNAAYEKIIANGSGQFLLEGVTGSGKTEIYLSVAKDILLQSKQVLILFPEIALTQQITRRIEKYFQFSPMIWNSNVSAKDRKSIWRRVISGESCLVIGARSALFLPFKNLGLVVIDEEHDSSYKQEEGGFYNARDMAVVLGHMHRIPIILSSATPSIETLVNAKHGKYGYASVENRFGNSCMPAISLIDMRQNKFDGFISPLLLEEIKNTISRNEQCLIYLNRRGYSPITLCQACGAKISCPNCTSWLVYHKGIDRLLCHYCGHKINIPETCQCCGEKKSYIQFGPGIERIFEELKRKLPSARVENASSDTISSSKDVEKLFTKIVNKETDIIVGTQILAKGHHFPDITLVGIVDGDLGLNGADLRASEKTYQLMHQVAGRAGRAEKTGKILIQTFNPDHSLFVALRLNNSKNFINSEIAYRKEHSLPPFCRLASVIISGTNKELTEKIAKELAKIPIRGVSMYGPAPASFFLLRGRTRWRILFKSSKTTSLNNMIRKWLFSQKPPKNIKIQIDIDPNSFL